MLPGREAGFARPVVVVTAPLVLEQDASVVHVVPLTSTIRGYRALTQMREILADLLDL